MPGLRKTLARLRDGERLVLTYIPRHENSALSSSRNDTARAKSLVCSTQVPWRLVSITEYRRSKRCQSCETIIYRSAVSVFFAPSCWWRYSYSASVSQISLIVISHSPSALSVGKSYLTCTARVSAMCLRASTAKRTQANPLGFMYHLEPRGGTVPIAIAERIQREPGIVQGGDGLFPNTDQTWSFV